MMLDDHVINLVLVKYKQKAYPKLSLTGYYHDDQMQFQFNDEQFDFALRAGAIIFRGSNAVHLWGLVFSISTLTTAATWLA